MESSKKEFRYVLANLGFAWAVYDTQVPQEYGFVAGGDKKHPSNNALNTRRVDIFPTRTQAQDAADELNGVT